MLEKFKKDLQHREAFNIHHYWNFLGYASKRNFKRYLENQPHSIGYWYSDLSSRKNCDDIYINAQLFLDILKEKNIDQQPFKDAIIESRIKRLRAQCLEQVILKNVDHFWGSFFSKKLSGSFYRLSLDTYTFANLLDIDPYDFFKIANEYLELDYSSTIRFQEKRKSLSSYNFIPKVIFNSSRHSKRYNAYLFLKKVKEHYMLTEIQAALLDELILIVDKILYDYVCQENKQEKKKPKSKNIKKLNQIQLVELNQYYRSAAKLCHPDAIQGKEDIFKELNEYNQQQNINAVKGILEKLRSQAA